MDGLEVHADNCPMRGPEIVEENESLKAEKIQLLAEVKKLVDLYEGARDERDAALLQAEKLKDKYETCEQCDGSTDAGVFCVPCWNRVNLQLSEIPKKILEAVNAEQLRCGKIAEAFWNEDDKLNADLRVKLTQAEKSMAYMISTNIRAMRWREENFTEKPKSDGWAICGWCAGTGKEYGKDCHKCNGAGGKFIDKR